MKNISCVSRLAITDSTGCTIQDVAHRCVSQDAGYFIRAFKQMSGVTPGR